VDLINSNFFTTYVVLWSRARNKSAFLSYADPAGRTISHVAAVVGSAALVELVEELGGTKEVFCAQDLTGVTPLSLAVNHALPSAPLMSALIARGAVPSCDDLETAMQRGYSRIVALLATAPGAPVPGGVSHRMLKGLRRASPPLPEQERERTPFLESTVFLVEALGRATIDAVKLWLGRAAGRPEKLNLALVLAAAFGHVESVELALEAGADVNCRHDAPTAHMHRAQPLHCAAASYQSRLDVVKVLVDAGADLNGMLPCGLHVLDVCGHSDVRVSNNPRCYEPRHTRTLRHPTRRRERRGCLTGACAPTRCCESCSRARACGHWSRVRNAQSRRLCGRHPIASGSRRLWGSMVPSRVVRCACLDKKRTSSLFVGVLRRSASGSRGGRR
jgi:hypothetical protein